MTEPHDPSPSPADASPPADSLDAGLAAGFAAPDATGPHRPEAEAVGTMIAGRYKLLEEIGEGGMGTVWVAEQTAPVKRKVALKFIKAGMDSRSVIARFEAERQTLALMDHPNIAKVLDGGLTEAGRPFFVMEYVKGVPITEYCDAVRLSIAERLQLFVAVCSAVQHAHQKGIIHRDLKPSNILVAPYDGKPVPKVIDFGLAKAMHQSLTERTLYTAHETVLGTPLYMSPEQAQLNNLDVDTRSDIYSLGVLLYELLTGTTPLERKRFKEAAWDEVRRIIREEEPPRPSARLSSSDTLPSLAACRQSEPKKLTKQLRGELDWIVMKSLEKDRTRRYETANGLARDIQRYLADEVVEARPPSAGYRLRKFVRRNKGRVIAALLVVAALVAGIIGTGWGLHEARQQRDDADKAREAEADLRADLQTQFGLLETEKKASDAARQETRLELHDNQRVLLRQAWEAGDFPKLRAVLDEMRPKPGETDLRGFETHYLDRVAQAEIDYARFNMPHRSEGTQPLRVRGLGGSGRIMLLREAARNRLYAWITAIDLATGEPAVGFDTILVHQEPNNILERGGTKVMPGDPPRLWTTDGYARNIRVWDARTGRLLSRCERLLPDAALINQGWRYQYVRGGEERGMVDPIRLCESANRIATRVITQLQRDVSLSEGLAARVESRAQIHDLTTGKATLCLDPRPGIITRAQFSFDDKYIVTEHRQGKYRFLFTVWDAVTGRPVWSKETGPEWSGFTRNGLVAVFGANATDPTAQSKEAYWLSTGNEGPKPPGSEVSYHAQPTSGPVVKEVGNKLEVRDAQTNTLLDILPRSLADTIYSDLHWGSSRSYWFGGRGELSAMVEIQAGWSVHTYRPSRSELIPIFEANQWADRSSRIESWEWGGTDITGRALFPYEAFDTITGKRTHVAIQKSWFGDRNGFVAGSYSAGRTLVISNGRDDTSPTDRDSVVGWNDLCVVDLETGQKRFTYSRSRTAKKGTVWSNQRAFAFSLSPDGTRIAALDPSSQRLVCLHAETGEQLWRSSPLPAEGSWRFDPLFLPDGRSIVLLDVRAGLIRILNASNGEFVKQLEDGPRPPPLPPGYPNRDLFDYWCGSRASHRAPWWAFGLTGDGRTLFYQSEGLLTLIDTKDWTVQHRLGEADKSDGPKWLPINDRFALRAIQPAFSTPEKLGEVININQ